MRVFVATKNAGKMRELRDIFAGSAFEIATFDDYADVAEGETSYEENAALKARALRSQLEDASIEAAVLGDDSGIEVRALGDRPGVLSARYGGPGASWADRRGGLIGELDRSGSADRGARFVCALHFIDPSGREIGVIETVEGELVAEERGTAGFSYDPIFAMTRDGPTFAEIPEAEKNRLSHRGRAAARLMGEIARRAACEPETAPRFGKRNRAGM